MDAEGLITVRSSHGPDATMNRFEAVVKEKGMTVFCRIDHASAAAAAGLPLRPTDLVVFGNVNAGTPLMQRSQAVGIDLPLKALVWQDSSGATWLSYNNPLWIAQRHELPKAVETMTQTMASVLKAIVDKIVAP